jgi:hypothetical protein
MDSKTNSSYGRHPLVHGEFAGREVASRRLIRRIRVRADLAHSRRTDDADSRRPGPNGQ